MSNRKYTPGPWVATHNGFYCDIKPGGDTQSLASAHDNAYPGGGAEANANLIAAAPELLEELEKRCAACRRMTGTTDDDCEKCSMGIVISKALGGTP